MASSLPTVSQEASQTGWKIEDYPSGYPRFAALLSSHPSFFAFRRFSTLRARMLLFKQDEISRLETDLEEVDAAEQRFIFNGSRRLDKNEARQLILAKLDATMSEYDELVGRTRNILAIKSARPRDVANLKSWTGTFGCISREETRYLWKDDLMAVGPSEPDEFLDTVGSLVEDYVIWLSTTLKKDMRTSVSRDPNLHIFPEGPIKTLSRFILAVIPLTILLIPIVIVSHIKATSGRLAVVFIANAIFVMMLSILAKPRMGELFAAGATYAAVLIVYVAGSTS